MFWHFLCWIWRLNNAHGFLRSLQPVWVQDCLATRLDQIIVKGFMHVVYKITLHHSNSKTQLNGQALLSQTWRDDTLLWWVQWILESPLQPWQLKHRPKSWLWRDCIFLMHFSAPLNSCIHSLFGSYGTCLSILYSVIYRIYMYILVYIDLSHLSLHFLEKGSDSLRTKSRDWWVKLVKK